jgi:hypothetical protein
MDDRPQTTELDMMNVMFDGGAVVGYDGWWMFDGGAVGSISICSATYMGGSADLLSKRGEWVMSRQSLVVTRNK